MKITSIDIIDVANDFSSATSKWRPTVVRVNTDEGISGFGEVGLAYGVGASGGIGVAKDLSALLIGMNPMDTEAIWEKMLRKTFWGQGGGPVDGLGVEALAGDALPGDALLQHGIVHDDVAHGLGVLPAGGKPGQVHHPADVLPGDGGFLKTAAADPLPDAFCGGHGMIRSF